MNQVADLPFSIDIETGLMCEAKRIMSPNCDERPKNEPISLVVVHGISLPPNQFGGQGVEQLFTNQINPEEHPYYKNLEGLKVSAHLFIRRDGEIIQFVPFNKRAWHAGVSEFKGQERCNDFSIGIELEGTDDIAYTEIQYQVLAKSIKALWQAYPDLKMDNVVGHSDIAPGRKTDPGVAFSWETLRCLLDRQA